ncbi:MAG: YggS family pyridoxal phosphate-dependent enzyme [Gammaproteobacteria bacterium]|nr:YggS family pyridoxal phosphate-dependent enzyme [Gammaproteobacteria bacterium]TVQ50171.1 MAG: YggS family pyridoxal phosphate-dependent enzyme [Gammaproteobacteria bacterium]
MTDLTERFRQVRREIESAAQVAKRDMGDITLVAVSKTRPAEAVSALAALGQRHFGENQAQEGASKIAACDDERLTWHFIGHLQSNKTRLVAEHFDWVHSLDREKIADRLSAQRPHYAPALEVCLQVALSDEATKGGVHPEALAALAEHVAGLPRLRLRGLMCLPPPPATPEDSRPYFRRLRELAARLRAAGIPIDQLSMGMSADLAPAIAEGATLVRVGTALFGARSTDGAEETWT